MVAPFAGAWIEITMQIFPSSLSRVAPFAGAWIEICTQTWHNNRLFLSLPSRERGLKYMVNTAELRGVMSLPSRERGLK